MSKIEFEKKQKTSVKAVNILVTVALVLAVILCFTVVTQVLSHGYVTLFGHSLFRVVTGSMEPEIPVGAILVSRETDITELRIGDIVCFFSVYGVGSTQFQSQFKAFRISADSDNFFTACNPGSHDGTHTDGSAAEDRNSGTESRTQHIEDSAGTCLDTAADRRDQSKVDVFIFYFYGSCLVDDNMTGERGLSEESREFFSVRQRDSCGSIRLDTAEVDLIQVNTCRRMPGTAVLADTAETERNTDMITGLEFGHFRSHFFYDSCAFVSENSRKRNRDKLVLDRCVCVADTTGNHANQDLVLFRRIKIDFLNLEWFTFSVCNGCFDFDHVKSPFLKLFL